MASIITPITSSLEAPKAVPKANHREGISTTRKPSRLRVQAMSPAKYKGTRMKEKHLKEMIEKKVTEAKEVCIGDDLSDECRVAWDEVEEVSEARAHLREKLEKYRDPLEPFCNDNPETDECHVSEDDVTDS
ncbi:hypothetical protein MLD38_035045 [Melastoma candidum]|uniref:Uncharacterized protein n=1 Tax=Melastoma candidum TaxID=119954 RepID=A0ACB9MFK9_9MYRT|nr:hypothetical protein MLD38_035045 [Melastoma candidum]